MTNFFGSLWHGFVGLPIPAKIIVGGIILIVLIVGTVLTGLLVAMLHYERTNEVPMVQIDCGPDKLTINGADIDRQLAVEPVRKSDESYHAGLGTDLGIGTVIYGRTDALQARRYTWKTPRGNAYELSIDPGGRVDLRQSNVTMTLGELSIDNGRRVLTWAYADEMTVLGRDLPQFKNDRGELLTNRYRLRHAPNDGQIFFRQTPTHYEQMYIRAEPYANDGDSLTVNAMVVDLKFPMLGRSYIAGKIHPDSTSRSKPVFYWQTWENYPITEADLRQFSNEAGQELGEEVVDFVRDNP
jgi:hypothetical protein